MTKGDPAALDRLLDSATGFDIDPLAVLLAKVNWVVANRDIGSPPEMPCRSPSTMRIRFSPACRSLNGTGGGNDVRLSLRDGVDVMLPVFLIEPTRRQLFDDLLRRAYALARAAEGLELDLTAASRSAAAALSGSDLDAQDMASVTDYFKQLWPSS